MGRLAPKGEFDMLYAVRKRRGRWTVCSDDNGVLQFENETQAAERCLNRETNRGIEAARTALEMVRVCRTLDQK